MQIERISIDQINPAPYNPRVDLRPGDPLRGRAGRFFGWSHAHAQAEADAVRLGPQVGFQRHAQGASQSVDEVQAGVGGLATEAARHDLLAGGGLCQCRTHAPSLRLTNRVAVPLVEGRGVSWAAAAVFVGGQQRIVQAQSLRDFPLLQPGLLAAEAESEAEGQPIFPARIDAATGGVGQGL